MRTVRSVSSASLPFILLFTCLVFAGNEPYAGTLAVSDPLERAEMSGPDPAAAGPAAETETSRPRRQRLSHATEIEGVPCHRYAWFAADGRLEACILSRDTELAGLQLPAGTKVEFYEDGHPAVCFLSRNTELEGHVCRGKGHGYMTTFHPNGRLRLCWLAKNEEVQGVPCKQASAPGEILRGLTGRANSGLRLHDNGRLESCALAREVTIDGQRLSKGKRIHFDAQGRLMRMSHD